MNFLETVLLVTHNGMGNSEVALQQTLMQKYLQLLLDNDLLPSVICFYTDGVKLVVDGSPFISLLKEFTLKGVHLIVCSTCLSFYGLQDQVQVGIVGGMTDIIEAQRRAAKVITL